MQRRRFLIISAASVAGLWGCGGSNSDTTNFLSQAPQGALLRKDVIFSSDQSVEVEANINGRGDVVYAVRSIGAGRSGVTGHVARSRGGALASEILVQPGELTNLKYHNPRSDLTGDAVSWLEIENGQTRIGAILGGRRITPWLPPEGFTFVQNLGLDGAGQFFAIADDGSGNSLLLRGEESNGTLTRFQFPFSGRLRMRMERGCRFAVGECSAGLIAFVLEGGVPRFQILSPGKPSTYSVNARGDISFVTANGDLHYFRRAPILPAFPAGVGPTPSGSEPVNPAILMGELYQLAAQAISQASENALNAQIQKSVTLQASTTQGIVTLYAVDTASETLGTERIFGVVATPNGVYSLSSLFTQQPGQQATELDIQESQGCVTLNATPGQSAPVEILRFAPA